MIADEFKLTPSCFNAVFYSLVVSIHSVWQIQLAQAKGNTCMQQHAAIGADIVQVHGSSWSDANDLCSKPIEGSCCSSDERLQRLLTWTQLDPLAASCLAQRSPVGAVRQLRRVSDTCKSCCVEAAAGGSSALCSSHTCSTLRGPAIHPGAIVAVR